MRADSILNGKPMAMELAHLRKLLEAEEPLTKRDKEAEENKWLNHPETERFGDVAVVSMQGMISHGLSWGERWWMDALDTDELSRAVKRAASDPGVRAIVLEMNSPGGMVVGVQELAEAVREANAKKPVVAHTSSLIASAAYWMVTGAEKILATASAEVGSIGCYAVHLDLSALYTMNGIRPVVFRSGENKAAGVYNTKLSPEQAKDIAESVEAVGAQFRKAVKDSRPGVEDEAMDGRVFTGERAVALGLADGISDLAGAVSAAREAADERERKNMELEQENARLKGELESANKLLDEAANLKTELEAARAENETLKAENDGLKDKLATAEEQHKAETDALKAEIAEKDNLLAAAPSALKTAGTDPVAGVFGGDNAGAPKDWTAALAACGGDYVAARRKYPDAWKATLG